MSRESWKERAKCLKRDVYALYLALGDPRTPWYAKVFMAVIILHTLSPVDLIPDFIPVLGQLDDLVVLPLGISVMLRMIPEEVMRECREKAGYEPVDGKVRWVGAIFVISIWLAVAYLVLRFLRVGSLKSMFDHFLSD